MPQARHTRQASIPGQCYLDASAAYRMIDLFVEIACAPHWFLFFATGEQTG